MPGSLAKPRLLVLTSTYPRWAGDPEPGFVHELCKRLTHKFDVIVLGPHAPGARREEVLDGVRVVRYRYAPTALEALVNDGGIVTNLRSSPWKWLLVPGFLLGQWWSKWRLLRRWKPDVIHAHWLLPQGLIAALGSRRVPFLVTSHGADLFALKARPLQVLKRFVAKRAAALTVVSPAMRDELARIGVDTEKVAVQPMGVDLAQRFTPDASIARSVDEVLFVGRLVEKKGVRHLIDAMSIIVATRPQTHLTIAGFGPEEGALHKQVDRLSLGGNVRFAGAVAQADLPAMYRRAAVFVAPFIQARSGDREGLGLVSVEAIGCGCPVIVSDLPTTRDLVAEPDSIVFVPPADIQALARAILSVLTQVGAGHDGAAAARQQVMQKYDWGVVSTTYAEMMMRQLPGR